MRSSRLDRGLAFIGAAVFLCCVAVAEEATVRTTLTLTEEEVRQIAASFLLAGTQTKGLAQLPFKVSTMTTHNVSVLYSLVSDVSPNRFALTVSPEARKVVRAYFGENSVASIAVHTSDGRTVDKDLFREEIVKVSIEEAEAVAREFIKERYGANALAGLERLRALEGAVGQGFEYGFWWLNAPDETGVRVGTRSFNVEVNPATGAVIRLSYRENFVTLKPVRTAEEVWALAEIRIGAEGPFLSVGRKGTQLSQLRRAGGDPFLLWVVSYDVVAQRPPGFDRELNISVDDDTGEVK